MFIEILSKFLLQTNGFGHKNGTYYNHVKYITMVIYIISLYFLLNIHLALHPTVQVFLFLQYLQSGMQT